MKRKRKESCPSPILDDSPKRTKVQAQRKFAQNSGVHSSIITPIRDLETADLPHTSVLPEPVELLPMKRPNTEDFLTFLCFRGTPILPPNLQFFNTASIVADGQVHEIKGDSPKNGPIDIAKCAGSSSEKPFIAFGVRKRADPIVISKQMERKRRHALAIQALRRKYQEQKMAKIRALTISKLSEKTTNRTLVKTNTIQKTETVTKKTNTLQKTKVIATKHVKVTTRTLKTKVKPKMCLRSFPGKFVQKELPFRAKRPLPEMDSLKQRPTVKSVVRTSRNSNKIDTEASSSKHVPKKPIKRLGEHKNPLKLSQVTTKSKTVVGTTAIKRPLVKKRIILPSSSLVSTIVKPKLRSTTVKKTVISRRKAQQRLRASINRGSRPTVEPVATKEVPKTIETIKKEPPKKKVAVEEIPKKPQDVPKQETSKRLTRKDAELASKSDKEKPPEKHDNKREITRNIELKKEVKIAESGLKKMIKKNVNLKSEYNLKSGPKDVKKNVAVQKSSDTVSERQDSGQKITRDVKTVETVVKKVVTRRTEDSNKASGKEKSSEHLKKVPKSTHKSGEEAQRVLRVSARSPTEKDDKKKPAKENPKNDKTLRKKPLSKINPKENGTETTNEEEINRRVTRDLKRSLPEKFHNETQSVPKKAKEHIKKEATSTKKADQEFSRKIKELIDNALKEAEESSDDDVLLKKIEVKHLEKKEELINVEEKHSHEVPPKETITTEIKKEETKIDTGEVSEASEEVKGEKNNETPEKQSRVATGEKDKDVPKKQSKEKTDETDNNVLKKPSKEAMSGKNADIPKKQSKEAIGDNDNPVLKKQRKEAIGEKNNDLPTKPSKLVISEKYNTPKTQSEDTINEKNNDIPKKSSKEAISEKNKDMPKKQSSDKDNHVLRKQTKETISDKNNDMPRNLSKEETSEKHNDMPKKQLKDAVSEKNNEMPKKPSKEAISEKNYDMPKKQSKEAICEQNSDMPKKPSKEAVSVKNNDIVKKQSKEEISDKNIDMAKKQSKEAIIGKNTGLPKRQSKETINEKNDTPKKQLKEEISGKTNEIPKKSSKEAISENNDTPKKQSNEAIGEKIDTPKKQSKEAISEKDNLVPTKQSKETIHEKDVKKQSKEETGEKVYDDPKKQSKEIIPTKNVVEPNKNPDDLIPKKQAKEMISPKKNPQALEKLDTIPKKPMKEDAGEKKLPNKKTAAIKKEDNPKRKSSSRRDESDNVPVASTRPSRKTKEAAAIYMELLSHKLVHESTIDDDNVSIDSFPELPNVKKTEQREIELKAQAQTSKEEGKSPRVDKTEDKKPKKVIKEETLEESKSKAKVNTKTVEKETVIVEDRQLLGKGTNPLPSDESDNEVLQAKIRKCESHKTALVTQEDKKLISEEKQLEEPERRQTRRSLQTAKNSDSDSSDESFHLDIKVPRKKKMTRRSIRAPVPPPASVLEKNVDIILEAARVLEEEKPLATEEVEENKPLVELQQKPIATENVPKKSPKSKQAAAISDSDESITSNINLKSLQVKQRKKLSKGKSSKSSAKSVASFSDSDEEPLAKLTAKTKSCTEPEEPKKKPEKQKSSPKKSADVTIMEPKPKRECTKRPGNYLPMLSSSDEDEPYFHGFNTKEETDKPNIFVETLAPSLDLLSKDIGRKGKVNMSNEQIEQWLKDSALASSIVAKENDAMLKFGEKIPAEVPKLINDVIIAEPVETKESEVKMVEPEPGCSKTQDVDDTKLKKDVKSPLADRKWIFKKDKKELMPNKNAFSPDNECSVYAFGEDNEDVVSTPFRRPSRRPSSTATSRSEDELSKLDESSRQGQFRKPNPSDSEDSRCFNIPQNPTAKKTSMVPPSAYHSKRQSKPSLDKFLEPFDDSKYKVPSSPSASSGSSAKLYKKGTQKQKGKIWESFNPVYVSDFPKPTDPAKLVEAPVFHPTEQEFQDPLEYIERIRHKAEQFGICKIIPPSSFKPDCKVSDDMRFTAYNQYVHKMLHRWGPNFKEFIAIKKYLATQSIFLKTPPLIGGMEIDLPRLYQTVQSLGGLKEVIEKKKWSKVSDQMKIPKLAQDRVTKLDDIYCKYLLPYDTLSPAEREKLFDEVETYWAKKDSRNLQEKLDPKPPNKDDSDQEFYDSDDNETEECTVKGKNMALNAFYRIARNTMSMYFKVPEPTAIEVEQEFWRYVTQKQNHICVHSASIDCGTWGYGFVVSKNSPFARHPWNLKVLSNNNGSVLRSLGPVMGVTIPTLHVGMVFSACCWYRDPHGLPWVEYLHTGGNKIWYGIPSSSCELFHAAMQKLVPAYCRDKELWLPSDTAMVPPGMLMEHNVSLCRTIQEPGQFVVVFPKVFTSSISTGYVVSESVYFAPLYWLRTARNLFNDLKTSCEPSMFSLDKLLVHISQDNRSSVEVLRVIAPFIDELCANERANRLKLKGFGKFEEEKITSTEPPTKKKKIQSVDGDFECEVCRMNLFASMVIDTQDDLIYCLEDALKLAETNPKMAERFKLKYNLDDAELDDIPKRVVATIDAKLQKKLPGKYAVLPTLLK